MQILKPNEIQFPTFSTKQIFNQDGQPITGYRQIYNVETGHVASIRSTRYTILNHENAYNDITNLVDKIYPDIQPKVEFLRNGQLMRTIFNLPEKINVVGDSLQARLVGLNSVDGTTQRSYMVEFLRLVCLNGMVGWSSEFNFSQKHTRKINDGHNDIKLAEYIKTSLDITMQNATKLVNKPLEYSQGMILIKDMVDRKLFPKKLEYFIQDFWANASNNKNSQSLENGDNVYMLYNAVTAAITHHEKNGQKMPQLAQLNVGENVTKYFLKLAA